MLRNHSAFSVAVTSGLDAGGRPYHLVVLSAAFEAGPDGGLGVARVGEVFRAADVCVGEAGQSSVRHEADTAPAKRRVDVLVDGHARAPAGRRVDRMEVSLQVADVDKRLVVSGDREGAGFGRSPAPRPFERMPIVYERAAGGTLRTARGTRIDWRNPVGIGFHGARSLDPEVRSVVPNVAYLDGRDAVAGLSAVSRQWQPRLGLAGTYDAAWRERRWPLLPDDFDAAYHQAAPADQQSATLRGGETVEVRGMTPEGTWRFRLPRLQVPLHGVFADRAARLTFATDTVLIEPDRRRVTLKARACVPVERGTAPLLQFVVGRTTPAALRALVTGKRHWNPARRAASPMADFTA